MGDPAMKTWQLRAGLVAGAVALACSITISASRRAGLGDGRAHSTCVARGSVLPTAHGVQPRRPRDCRRRACRPIRRSTTWARAGGVCKSTDAGGQWMPVTDGQIGVGTIGAIAVAESNPNIIYVGTGSACPRGNVSTWRRRVQVDRRRQDVAAHRPAEGRADRPHPHPSAESRTSRTSRCSATSSDRTRSAASTARRTAARPGSRCSRSAIAPAPSTSRWTSKNPERPACRDVDDAAAAVVDRLGQHRRRPVPDDRRRRPLVEGHQRHADEA